MKSEIEEKSAKEGELSVWSVGGIGVLMILACVGGSALGFRMSKRFVGNEVSKAVQKQQKASNKP